MKSKDSTNSKAKNTRWHSRDDSFHLYSILLVIALTLISWGVETLGTNNSTSSSSDLLLFLNAIPDVQVSSVEAGCVATEPIVSNSSIPSTPVEAPKVIPKYVR